MIERIIRRIVELMYKYDFDYLDCYENELKFEYVGNDLIYKEEEDFETKDEWRKFEEEQGAIVEKHFEKAINEVKKKVKIDEYDYDEYDYPCVYVYFNEWYLNK